LLLGIAVLAAAWACGRRPIGNDPRAPYFKEHQAAINPEMWLAYYLDLDWKEYVETLENLE
jgi:hypothetical protein